MTEVIKDEVTIDVAAPPERVWSLISDVTRMGEWSPICTRCEWLGGSTGPKVGARFSGQSVQRGARLSRESVVTASEPGREFAFHTIFRGKVSTRWKYNLEPIPQGTRVTESYEVIAMPLWVKTIRRIPGMAERSRIDTRNGMQVTLERIKAAAEG